LQLSCIFVKIEIMFKRLKIIAIEAKAHAPFTLLGAVAGILFMLIFQQFDEGVGHWLFAVFHPAHVVLSAMITAAMFRLHLPKRKHIVAVVAIGYFGSIGVATVSDIMLPHLGLDALGLRVPVHADVHHAADHDEHSHEHHEDGCEHGHNGFHFGFIEEWYLVNPAALLGIVIAFFLPRTRLPHAGHVLVSTWASSAYMLMDPELAFSAAVVPAIFLVLFLSVWVPCCLSDIVFPLLFVPSDAKPAHGHCHWCGADKPEDEK